MCVGDLCLKQRKISVKVANDGNTSVKGSSAFG